MCGYSLDIINNIIVIINIVAIIIIILLLVLLFLSLSLLALEITRIPKLYMLFDAGRSVLGKTEPEVLSTARGRRPGPCSRPRAQFFSIRTDLGRQITCLFFLSGKLLYKKYLCLFFTEAVSHRARAFDVSGFLRLDNKIHFRYDSCHYPNP